MTTLLDDLKALRVRWREEAMGAVPEAYATKNMHAGLSYCANELDALLEKHSNQASEE